MSSFSSPHLAFAFFTVCPPEIQFPPPALFSQAKPHETHKISLFFAPLCYTPLRHPRRPMPEISEGAGRLDSWKEIATYLGREVRTVQLWEKNEGLPIHRHQHARQGSVYAFKSELDAWRTGRKGIPDAPVLEAAPRRRPIMLIAGAFLILAAAGFLLWKNFQTKPPTVSSVVVLPFLDLSPQKDQDYFSDGLTEEIIDALTRMTDTDSLAAAGLLGVGTHRDQSLSLIGRAVASAPERADLVWLEVQVCNEIAPCNSEPIEQRLRELDPSNGAGWLGPLARASVANNEPARDAALTALSRSDRVDFYYTTLVAHLSRAVVSTGKISAEIAEVWVIGFLAREAIPAYQYVSNACKGERLQNIEVTQTCRGVASSLQNGDTYLTEMIGVAIAKRVWPENSAEWNAAVDARRVYDYRSKLFSAV